MRISDWSSDVCSSDLLTGFGNSYGDFYRNSLVNSRVRSLEFTESGAIINWFSAIEGLTWTDNKYTTANGETNMVRLNHGDERIICPHYKSRTGFQFSSYFIP